MQIDKIYLDTNLIIGFFKNIIKKKKYKEDPKFIRFLSDKNEIQKFISIFTVAEVIQVLRKEFGSHDLSKRYILDLIDTLRGTVGLNIIENVELTSDIIHYTYLCDDLKDAVHVSIAQINDIWFVTRDDDAGKTKELYNKVISERKFIKQFKE